ALVRSVFPNNAHARFVDSQHFLSRHLVGECQPLFASKPDCSRERDSPAAKGEKPTFHKIRLHPAATVDEFVEFRPLGGEGGAFEANPTRLVRGGVTGNGLAIIRSAGESEKGEQGGRKLH